VSNALGTVTPVGGIVERAHAIGARVLIDGCQAIPHMPVDVQSLDADFYVFSGHKLYGPTGIGVLYGKADILDAMPPYQGGGEMIRDVTFERSLFKAPPYRFEAGTPAIVEAIGLGAAVDYLQAVGMERIQAHDETLLAYATERLLEVPGLTIYGNAGRKAAIVSFGLRSVHPHDIATILDRAGVAIRAGHHCAQPVMDRLGVPATARASFAMYNTPADVDVLVEALGLVGKLFS
jgi:cysteine desulfurase/selenocysteine lyase